MPKLIGISAVVGFFLSLAFLTAVSFYAITLRAALINCRQTQTTLSNQVVRCENRIHAVSAHAEQLTVQIAREKSNARALESRLEAAGALRRCASLGLGQS
ncbi:MAG: hypothetical protein AB7E79_14770 [Rhodospirillaceae bacterium]